MSDNKYIYLIGNKKQGYMGFTMEKSLAKEFVKGRPNFHYVKVNANSEEFKRIDINSMTSHDEVVSNAYGNKYLMFSYEEEFFIESFMDFVTGDIPLIIEDFIYAMGILKFDDDEKPPINTLIRILQTYLFDLEHGLLDDGTDHYFDYDKAADYFVENNLGV